MLYTGHYRSLKKEALFNSLNTISSLKSINYVSVNYTNNAALNDLKKNASVEWTAVLLGVYYLENKSQDRFQTYRSTSVLRILKDASYQIS